MPGYLVNISMALGLRVAKRVIIYMPILIPSSTDFRILLIYGQRHIVKEFRDEFGKIDPRYTAADNDYTHGSWRSSIRWREYGFNIKAHVQYRKVVQQSNTRQHPT